MLLVPDTYSTHVITLHLSSSSSSSPFSSLSLLLALLHRRHLLISFTRGTQGQGPIVHVVETVISDWAVVVLAKIRQHRPTFSTLYVAGSVAHTAYTAWLHASFSEVRLFHSFRTCVLQDSLDITGSGRMSHFSPVNFSNLKMRLLKLTDEK